MSLLPPNATALESAMEAAIVEPALPVPLRDLWNPQTCPEHLLPWLAWSLSVDNWDSTWPVATRRAVVANAIAVHRRKGTVAAVRAAISAFGANMALREWWETSPKGTRGTFTVVLSVPDDGSGAPSAAIVDAIVAEIDRAKPLSRHFTFGLSLAGKAQVGLIAAARPAAYFRLNFSA